MSTTDPVLLLRRYAERGDEGAFRELVERYIDLVYSTAVRRVGGDADLGRDVAQTVFSDLARKAGALKNVEALGGWLHRHTGFVASTFIRRERSRRAREQEAAQMNAESSETVWLELAPVLDETIDGLEAEDRKAIMLRFFEHQDLRSVGAALGVSEDAAQKRVSRAVEKLRALLTSRGVTLSAVLLAGLLAGRAVTGAPAGMAAALSKTALAAVSGAGAAVTVAKLANSLAFKGAIAATVIAVVGWLIVRSKVFESNHTERQGNAVAASQDAAGTAAPVATAPGSPAALPAQSPSDSSNTLVIKIVTADSGKPIPDVAFDCWRIDNGDRKHETGYLATRFGVCTIPVVRGQNTSLIMVSECDGFADTRLEWDADKGQTIPAEYTLRLARAVHMGGIVVDPDGKPIEGAHVAFGNQPDATAETFPECRDFGWPYHVEMNTGPDGRWAIDRVAKEALSTIGGGATHPDFVGADQVTGKNPDEATVLTNGNWVFKLKHAVTARGLVTGEDGQPISGAKVWVGNIDFSGSRQGHTGPDGYFVIRGCAPGQIPISAEATNFGATTTNVDLTDDSPPVQLALKPGRVLRIRVTDSIGQGISNAYVSFDSGPITFLQMKGASTQTQFQRTTDANGRVEWDNAPEGELHFDLSAKDCMRASQVLVPADGVEHTVSLKPALTISGTVRDASTGKPIPHFRVITGWPDPSIDDTNAVMWSTIDRFWVTFDGGDFRHVYEEPVVNGMPGDSQYVFKFDAEGYAPFITRIVNASEVAARFEVALRPATMIAVQILLPNGQPAALADVGMLSPGARIHLTPTSISRDNVQSAGSVQHADDHGRFDLPPDETITRVIAVCADGIADATHSDLAAEPTLQLQPWGRLEGIYRTNLQAVSGTTLSFHYGMDMLGLRVTPGHGEFEATTDENGRFLFPKIPAGRHLLTVRTKRHGVEFSEAIAPMEIRAGETNTIIVGAASYTVKMRVHWPDGMTQQPNWVVHATLAPPGWQLNRSLVGPHNFAKARDGGWSVNDVDTRDYELIVEALDRNDGTNQPAVHAKATQSVSVPSDPPSGTIDLGDVWMKAAE